MPSIGQQLKEARESRGLSIKQVVQATRIRAYYLEAMETDDFSSMPSAAQARGFLRAYADFLQLNADDLVGQQRNQTAPVSEFITPDQAMAEAVAPSANAGEAPEPQPETVSQAQPPQPEPILQEPEPAPTGGEESPAAPKVEPSAPSVSQLIFAEIGSHLRQRRELLSLTLDEIERHTHVRKHYLEVIESGDFDGLPSPVQARGMLSNYSSFLDMDTDAILLRFADALQAGRVERQASLPTPASSRRRMTLPLWVRHLVSPDLIIGGAMILLIFLLTVWGAGRIFSKESAQPTQGPSISDVLLSSPVAATPVVTEALPTDVAVNPIIETELTLTPTEIDSSEGDASLQLTISVFERTFVRVTVDGEIELDGRVVPGFAQTFNGKERIEVLTGSGAAIQIMLNQRNLGPMGSIGQVVDLIYTANGPQTPTMTPSPTLTVTPRFQKTPTMTPTPTPSLTATATTTPTARP